MVARARTIDGVEEDGHRRSDAEPGTSAPMSVSTSARSSEGRGERADDQAERQDGMVSPELVLIDPRLARWARERLPERPETPTPVIPATLPVASTHEPLETNAQAPPAATARPRRRRRAVALTVSVLLGLALAAILVDQRLPGVRSEAGDALPTFGEQGAPPASKGSARTAPPPPVPVRPARRVPATRRFAWAPSAGASGYHVELFKGSVLVFRADSTRPEIVIPKRWRLKGRVRRLVPGAYRWYVWPRVAGRRQARAIVQAKLILPTR